MQDQPHRPETERPLTSETIQVLQNRVSVRSYTDEPVSEATVDAVLKAAFRAPTSSNIQAYSVVAVRDPDVRAELAPVTGNQRHVLEAPVFLAFCADLTRIEAALTRNGHDLDDNNFEMGLVATVDAALVGMSAYLAADSLGLKGVMIGAVRNDALATARILGLPRRVYCVFGMCLGWPDDVPPQKPRMDFARMVHHDQYGRLGDDRETDTALADYDAALAAHYADLGKPTTPDSWTHDVDKKFHARPRDELRQQLAALGFDFK